MTHATGSMIITGQPVPTLGPLLMNIGIPEEDALSSVWAGGRSYQLDKGTTAPAAQRVGHRGGAAGSCSILMQP